MARHIQLPCDGEGTCMLCKAKPPPEETLTCGTCVASWHVACLSSPPETLASTLQWECPDCSGGAEVVPASGVAGGLVAAIRAIEADESLTEMEKAKKRQELMGGKAVVEEDEEIIDKKGKKPVTEIDLVAALGENLNCSFCLQLPERPVTTPCGHNFCLKCFQKWTKQGKNKCAKCRKRIPKEMARNPHINSALVSAIRLAKTPKASAGPSRSQHFIRNEDRPDKAFMTERAQKSGTANAASGRIMVTTHKYHFGPIPAENDPLRNQGVLVGETWKNRQDMRQWGVHYPHVGGIAGQTAQGAQSVVLSAGYDDDEDHGDWFIYTGSGGKDLSGNRRTNKEHAWDQDYRLRNAALRLSCQMGYPVRVIRSEKERNAYAPETGLRYDGIYRIEQCWRRVAGQGFYVCLFLFVRCDNDPAPWTSDEHGDRPRPLPEIPEPKRGEDIFEREESPSWDFDEADGRWKWVKPPPPIKKAGGRRRTRKGMKEGDSYMLLKEFSCQICREAMSLPVTTPCAHNFCKECLEAKFAGLSLMRERSIGGRTLRKQKNPFNCPCCSSDLSEFLQDMQVNTEVMTVIEKLKSDIKAAEEARAAAEASTGSGSGEGSGEGSDETVEAAEEKTSDNSEPEPVSEAEEEPPSKRVKLDTDNVCCNIATVEAALQSVETA